MSRAMRFSKDPPEMNQSAFMSPLIDAVTGLAGSKMPTPHDGWTVIQTAAMLYMERNMVIVRIPTTRK